jgi:hypothetical protein
MESNARRYLKKQNFNPDKCVVILQGVSGMLHQVDMVQFLEKFETHIREQDVENVKNFAINTICDLVFGKDDEYTNTSHCDEFTHLSEK